MLSRVKIRKILEMGANLVIALALESKIGQDNDWQCSDGSGAMRPQCCSMPHECLLANAQ